MTEVSLGFLGGLWFQALGVLCSLLVACHEHPIALPSVQAVGSESVKVKVTAGALHKGGLMHTHYWGWEQ